MIGYPLSFLVEGVHSNKQAKAQNIISERNTRYRDDLFIFKRKIKLAKSKQITNRVKTTLSIHDMASYLRQNIFGVSFKIEKAIMKI